MTKEELKDKRMLALEAAREATKGQPRKQMTPLEKAIAKPTTLNCAKAMCYQCMGEGADIGWKWMIGNCTSPKCALYPVRPYRMFLDKPKPKGVV